MAINLAGQQCALALSDVNQAGLAETAQLVANVSPNLTITTATIDVSQRDAMHSWAAQVVADHGRINLIINNAGVAHAGTVLETDYADYEWIMNINFWGVVHGTKAFLPYLIDSGEGHVVNVSSVFGLFAQPMVSAYNATKFAVRGFTESLRQELDMANNGVSASCVHPGGVKTNIAQNARVDNSVSEAGGFSEGAARAQLEKMFKTTAEQAAATIVNGVKHDKRRILIGLDAKAADAMQRSAPAGYQKLVTAAMRRMS